jgi:hypothetical protein
VGAIIFPKIVKMRATIKRVEDVLFKSRDRIMEKLGSWGQAELVTRNTIYIKQDDMII